ncbi:hypothetical protein M430DRAFT_203687 [Amorphotheca resinae ATCC 22711]|uniref:Uncharacterized protein n=1 Tax=Amorphotheca resinae ATCC 22711 TaxID=857342 RepID=A0A2T3BB47_AMORE|nr:hypothetical protein M430DRAFT_203687 [Amorphotheca resinae ATCC 22711]PSS25545.1 hypothetical protein M430DRAFT_203687 [Amorphotheca resinae ATCC 22711]
MALPTRAPPGDWGKGKGKRAARRKRGFHMSARRIRLSDGAKRVEIFLFSFAFYLFCAWSSSSCVPGISGAIWIVGELAPHGRADVRCYSWNGMMGFRSDHRYGVTT